MDRFFLYLLFIILGGCSTFNNEDEVANSDERSIDLSGNYRNLSEGKQKLSLVSVFLTEKSADFYQKIDCVRLNHSARNMTFYGMAGHQVIYKRTFNLDSDYTVLDGKIIFKGRGFISGFKSGEAVLGPVLEGVAMSKGGDNKLNVTTSTYFAGLAYMFLPVVYGGDVLRSFDQCKY